MGVWAANYYMIMCGLVVMIKTLLLKTFREWRRMQWKRFLHGIGGVPVQVGQLLAREAVEVAGGVASH